MPTKDQAICIRASDYSETSQVVTFFTRETGKLDVIAKGSKRPRSAFDGPIEVFSSGQIVFSDSGRDKLATLFEFEQQPLLRELRHNFFALNCALLGAELINNLTDAYDPHPQLFDSFQQFLQNVAKSTDRAGCLSLLILFELALLSEIGIRPALNACTNCGSEVTRYWTLVYFSSSANGLLCRDCEASFPDRIRLSKEAALCLSHIKSLAAAKERTLKEVEKVLLRHFTEILHRPPKMAKYFL